MAKESFQGSAFTKRGAEKRRKHTKALYPSDRVCVRKTKKAGKVRYDIYAGPKKKRG